MTSVDSSLAAWPPVVLVHGSRTSRSMWRDQLAALRRAGVDALAVDLPGHGARRGEAFTLDGAVEAVAAGIDDVGGRALVVGLSLGGYVAIETRARHPERVVGLVAAACSTPPATRLRGGWLLVARGIERLPDGGAGLNQALVDRALTPQGAADLAAGGFALDVMSAILREVEAVDPVTALAATDSPVWLVNGRWDHFRFGERGFVEAARRGGAPVRLVVVPGARHLVSLDAPVTFNRVLLDAHRAVATGGPAPGADGPAPAGVAPRRAVAR
ncbi:alpha/beta hydrolase [Cellulosimicrobium cellulans]|uniref:alpha/beta fold hydrolase n=1 Tax=Cellulosimicrobium cellulans TaxID=1710 RepID=UPI0028A93E89|nr:alpha/beta hydrolase [Cellulosimicrobium cellulans]